MNQTNLEREKVRIGKLTHTIATVTLTVGRCDIRRVTPMEVWR